MKKTGSVESLKQSLSKTSLTPVGFVPTMGALHEGHLVLVKRAVAECPLVVVSIFVNPTQFNDSNDLKNYPRTPESDEAMLSSVLRPSDVLFMPTVDEMYPGEDRRQFSFGNLDRVMEALHRPGHFNGVAQIVSKLFEIVNPDRAYFGLKDFQQLAVIKALVKQMKIKTKIVPCEIVREKDGLAMSSRNRLLDPLTRMNAPVIFETISTASGMLREKDIAEVRNFVFDTINNVPGFRVGYFEVADDVELIPVNQKQEMMPGRNYYACIAVNAGKIRLIDNVRI